MIERMIWLVVIGFVLAGIVRTMMQIAEHAEHEKRVRVDEMPLTWLRARMQKEGLTVLLELDGERPITEDGARFMLCTLAPECYYWSSPPERPFMCYAGHAPRWVVPFVPRDDGVYLYPEERAYELDRETRGE